jgi:hypothetical protein
MRALAFAALLAGGCTLVYGPSKIGNTGDADMSSGGGDGGTDDGGTDDAGPSIAWSTRSSGTLQDLHAIVGCDPANLFAPGTGGTLDRATMLPTWMPSLLGALDLLGASASTCSDVYVVGKAGTAYFASDGHNFTLRTVGSADLNAVWSNGVGAAAVGTGGAALYVALGSNKFAAKASGTTQDLFAVWGAGAIFYAAGAGGTILRSTNSGMTWTAKTFGAATLRGGWASATGNDVYAVGDGGTILHSSDAGTTWPAATSGTSVDLRAVWGSAPNDVYAVGDGGTILRSVDGGQSWSAETSNTTADLHGVWGASAGDVWAVGTSGALVHRP